MIFNGHVQELIYTHNIHVVNKIQQLQDLNWKDKYSTERLLTKHTNNKEI
jgi:hypothetical protein